MSDSPWFCPSCGNANRKDRQTCFSCGSPAPANGKTLEHRKIPPATKPELPTHGIFFPEWTFFIRDTENCPACKMHMYLSDRQCPHCGFVQDSDQRHAFLQRHKMKKTKAMWQGAIFMIGFLGFLTLFFYCLGPAGH